MSVQDRADAQALRRLAEDDAFLRKLRQTLERGCGDSDSEFAFMNSLFLMILDVALQRSRLLQAGSQSTCGAENVDANGSPVDWW